MKTKKEQLKEKRDKRLEEAIESFASMKELIERFPSDLDYSIFPKIEPQIWESDKNHSLKRFSRF